ncbi:hypothetical protein MR478_02825 [bacterium]|nr:hypothetical protein [bacterium]
MKKTYMKPSITMEYFTLNQSIATSCGWTSDKFYGRPMHGDPTNCAWVEADGTMVWTATPTCDGAYREDLEVTDGCYNAPYSSQQVFAS